jgi:probable phosphoglycerate mutase
VEHDGFGEFRMGDYEGMAWTELIELDSWREYLARPHETTFPGGGESLVGIRDRAVAAFNDVVGRHGGGRLVITTHGGIARLLMLTALDAPLSAYHRLSMPNAGISRLRLVPGRAPKVLAVSWSQTPGGTHL